MSETLDEMENRELWSAKAPPEIPADGWLARLAAWIYRHCCAPGATTARERVLLENYLSERQRRRDAQEDQQRLANRVELLEGDREQMALLLKLANVRIAAQVQITQQLADSTRPRPHP